MTHSASHIVTASKNKLTSYCGHDNARHSDKAEEEIGGSQVEKQQDGRLLKHTLPYNDCNQQEVPRDPHHHEQNQKGSQGESSSSKLWTYQPPLKNYIILTVIRARKLQIHLSLGSQCLLG